MKNSEPAFPQTIKRGTGHNNLLKEDVFFRGLTIRDYFAAKAMQAFICDTDRRDGNVMAKWAYEIADAMLSEREK